MSMNLSSYLGVFVKFTPNSSDIEVYDLIEDYPLCGIRDEGDNLPKGVEFVITNDGEEEFDLIENDEDSGLVMLESLDISHLKQRFEDEYLDQLEILRANGAVEICFGSIRYWG